MKRRDLLKAAPLLPVLLNGRQIAANATINASRRCIVFVNENAFPASRFEAWNLPKGTIICPISVPEGQKIDDVIRLYELPQ